MTGRPVRTVGVVVRGAARAAEALRAAVGLTLAGDRVIAALLDGALPALDAAQPGSPLRRHVDTLRALGHEVAHGPAGLGRVAEVADVVEIWS